MMIMMMMAMEFPFLCDDDPMNLPLILIRRHLVFWRFSTSESVLYSYVSSL